MDIILILLQIGLLIFLGYNAGHINASLQYRQHRIDIMNKLIYTYDNLKSTKDIISYNSKLEVLKELSAMQDKVKLFKGINIKRLLNKEDK